MTLRLPHIFWPLAVIFFVLAGCAHGLEEGTEALSAGDYDQAQTIAAEGLADDPQSPWANQLMAETLAAQGEHRQALEYAQRADEEQAFPVRTPRLLGQIYSAIGRPVDAARAYHRARQSDIDSVDDETFVAVLEQALAYAQTRSHHEDHWQIIGWLADVDADHPSAGSEDRAGVRRALAVHLRQSGEYLRAVELLEEALAGDHRYLRSEALDLGELYARLEMKDDAARAWRIYLDADVDADESIQRHLDVATVAARHDLVDIAIDALDDLPDAIDDVDRRADIMLELAHYQLRSGQTTEARRTLYDYLALLTDGADDGQASSIPFQNAAELATTHNQTRLAIDLLERAIENAEPSRALTRKLSDIYARRAQLDRVEETMDRFIERSQDSVESIQFAGQWARERNNYALARHYFERATGMDGAPSSIWYDLAGVLGALDEHDAMIRALNNYTDERSASFDALSRAAELYGDHGLYEEAERLLLRLQERDPTSRTVARQLAALYHDWSRPADAAQVWESWVDARGNDPGDIESVARLLLRSGEPARAARFFVQAAEAGVVDAWLEAADIYLRQNHPTKMIEALEAYLEAAPDRADALEETLRRYRRAGMESRHIGALTELIELRPDSWDFHERLASILINQGRTAEAFSHLERFVDRSDDPAAALERIGSRLTSSHRASWLLDFYRTWSDDDRVHPVLLRLMGDAYYALSNADSLSQENITHAQQRARSQYLAFLDATDDGDHDWRQLAHQWRQKSMWRPAAKALERHAEVAGSGQLYSVAYAETQLHLGQSQRAHEILETYFQREQRNPRIAGRIAGLLQQFGHYDQAERYASHLFLTGNDNHISDGFHILAELYEQQEEYEKLQDLVTNYIDRASNTTRARRAVISVLDDAGQWQAAADRLSQFELSTLYQFAVEMGFHHYRAGDRDRAFTAFEEAAHHARRPERTWTEAAEFFATRGDIEGATIAFERAVQANPDDLGVRTARGTFLIGQGAVNDGLYDYQFARGSTTTFRVSDRTQFFEALANSGHYDRARQVLDELEDDGLTAPGAVQLAVGRLDLRSQAPDVRQRAIERISAGTWSVHEKLDHLETSGRIKDIVQLIDEEFAEGDATTAAIMLLTRPTSVSRVTDWNQQIGWLRAVVDPLARSNARLIGPVGDTRARSGRLDEARLYLQAAVDHRQHNFAPQLAHTLLLLGERRQALDHFETHLLETEASSRALESILLRFELAGDASGAVEFLQRVTDEPSLIDLTLPYRTHYELERHGDPRRAIADVVATLESLQKLPSTAFRDGATARTIPGLSPRDILADALVRSLETIAALGHVEAVEAAVSDGLSVAPSHQLRRLRLKLALAVDDISTAQKLADEILAATDGARQLRETRLQLAKKFVGFGATEPARRLVDAAVEEQSDFRSHEPFILKVGLHIIDDDPDLDSAIADYLQKVPNRHHARMTLLQELRRMGRDTEALTLAREGVEKRPTADMLRHALGAALDEGDGDAVVDFTDRLFLVADDPVDDVASIVGSRMPGTEPELLLPIIDKVLGVRPHDLDWNIEYGRILFDDGQIQAARDHIAGLVEDRDYNRDAVTEVADMLASENLDVELARVLAVDIPDHALWPHLIILFAEAEFALGFSERAEPWLQRLDQHYDDAPHWRVELADRLVARQHFKAIGTALTGVENHPDIGPYADFLRGVYQLNQGDSSGLETIRQANTDGVDRFRSHFAGIQAALQAGDPSVAISLMDDLNSIPVRDNQIVSLPLQISLGAAMREPGGPQAIRTFLEDQRPRLVDGHGATWTQFAGQLASAFEHTDDPEGAYGFYRDRIWQALLHRDDDGLPIYLNNLAYTYSTTDHRLDDGLDLIRRAMVLRDQRSASLIDTLGWLYYRQGDTERAEAEIRRALRTYSGRTSGLQELLRHLEVLLYERHDSHQAAWINTHRNRLPPDVLDW